MLISALLLASGCLDSSDSEDADYSDSGLEEMFTSQGMQMEIQTATVDVTSENRSYPTYIAAPIGENKYPTLILLHSFKGFEPGYRTLVDRMASEGYVVVVPQWQTYSQTPTDQEVENLVLDSMAYLRERNDVDSDRLGLTGFCAGGRYTMLFLAQIPEFNTGVAWYGFPFSGDTEDRPKKPADLAIELDAPMLMLHGSRDEASNVSDIYSYAAELDAAGKYFELKVYQGEPHGFMFDGEGELSETFVTLDAYREMMNFFDRTLR